MTITRSLKLTGLCNRFKPCNGHTVSTKFETSWHNISNRRSRCSARLCSIPGRSSSSWPSAGIRRPRAPGPEGGPTPRTISPSPGRSPSDPSTRAPGWLTPPPSEVRIFEHAIQCCPYCTACFSRLLSKFCFNVNSGRLTIFANSKRCKSQKLQNLWRISFEDLFFAHGMGVIQPPIKSANL